MSFNSRFEDAIEQRKGDPLNKVKPPRKLRELTETELQAQETFNELKKQGLVGRGPVKSPKRPAAPEG